MKSHGRQFPALPSTNTPKFQHNFPDNPPLLDHTIIYKTSIESIETHNYHVT